MSGLHFSHRLRTHLAAISRWVLPPRCLLCSEPGGQHDLCAACLDALPRNTCACPRCALPLPFADTPCGRCLKDPPAFSSLIAPWRYEDGLTKLIPRFKFHRNLAAGRVLAEFAQAQTQDWPGWQNAACLVPIPLHASRLAQRGYNQALELARVFARHHRLPLRPDLLSRQHATAAQTELNAAIRRRNLRGAFRAPPLTGQILILVDDVATTTATLQEAARTLRRAGAGEVHAVVLARTP